MEIRRFAGSVLRSRTSPLLAFLVPSISCPTLLTIAPHHTLFTSVGDPSIARQRRTIQSSQRYASSAVPDETAARDSRDGGEPPNKPRNDSPTSIIDNLLTSTLFDKPSPGGTRRRTSDYIDPSFIGKPSSDSVAKISQSPLSGSPRQSQGALASSMDMPRVSPSSSANPSRDMAKQYSEEPATRASLTIRSRPSVGRTVEVNPDRGMNLGRALRSMEIACALNKVRQDQAKQRFHERPGSKRKRLKSERWRAFFKAGFRHIVQKVKVMRRKGW